MSRAPKGLEQRIDELAEMLRAGYSYRQIGDHLGCNRSAVRYWARKIGLESQHMAGDKRAIYVTIDGVERTLPQIAAAYGRSYSTVFWRYRHGYRGHDLVTAEVLGSYSIVVDKVRYTIPEAARVYGVSESTIYKRRAGGYNGYDLVRKDLRKRAVFDFGLTAGELAEYRELALRYQPEYCANKLLGWPLGAVNALRNGEEHRFV